MAPNWACVAWGILALICSAAMFVFGDRLRAANLKMRPPSTHWQETRARYTSTALGFLAMGGIGVIVGIFFPGSVRQ